MGDNTKKISSQVMELKDLISGPLIATVEADSASSRQYLDYLFDIGFESYSKETGEVGKLRMLTFNFMQSSHKGQTRQKVSIPLLSLVPLPLLQVKEADFDFEIQIIDAVKDEAEKTFSLKTGEVQQDGTDDKKMKLRVSIAPSIGEGTAKTTLQQGLTANMKVKVRMQQADLPGGLANLLHLTANNMTVEEEENNDNNNRQP